MEVGSTLVSSNEMEDYEVPQFHQKDGGVGDTPFSSNRVMGYSCLIQWLRIGSIPISANGVEG